MKKILALLLALVMLIGVLAGCTNQTQPNDDPDATGDPSTTIPEISPLVRRTLPMLTLTNLLFLSPLLP